MADLSGLSLWQACGICGSMGHNMLPQDGHHAGVAMSEAGHGAQDVLKHLPPS